MRKPRLFWQLFVAYLVINLGAVLAVGLYASYTVNQLYLEHLSRDLEARASLCAPHVGDLLKRGALAEVRGYCEGLRDVGTRVTVILPSGEVVGDNEEDARNMENHKDRPEVRDAMSGPRGSSIRYSVTRRQEMNYLAIPIRDGREVLGVVRTALPVTKVRGTLASIYRQVALVGLGACGLIIVLSLAASRWLSRPLREINAGAQRFARGQLDHRLPLVGAKELCTVAEAMNRMAEQLNERIHTIRRQQYEREAMLASMQEGVLAVDNEGAILSLNDACAAMLGVDAEGLKGRPMYEAVRRADLLEWVEAILSQGTSVEGVVELPGPPDRWLHVHGTALHDAQQRRIGAPLVLYDVTRLRHLESIRRDFVANVSHELRTPVTSIKGFVETLLEGAMDDRENAQRFLHIILNQVNRLSAIIGDLLSLSRIERGSGEQLIEFASERVRDVLQAAIDMCRKKADDKQVSIALDCPEDLLAQVNASLLEQAVVNLLDNGVKYSDAGGSVQIAASCEESDLVIRVTDQGCGIEAKHLPRLFERFYRVDKARSREQGGTGLGLAIVKHIALAHRGTVSVQSTIGRGSSFVMRLPVVRPEPPA